MDEDVGGIGARGLRTIGVVGSAALLTAVAVAAFLRPTTAASTPVAERGTVPKAAARGVSAMTWATASVGWITVFDPATKTWTLFQTSDAGRRWQHRYDSTSEFVAQFFDSERGLLVWGMNGAPNTLRLLHTDDGGAHWASVPQPLTMPYAGVVLPAFSDPDHVWLLNTASPAAHDQPSALYRTLDGGLHWEELLDANLSARSRHGIAVGGSKKGIWFTGSMDGWISTVEPDGTPALHVTHDGGREWTSSALPPGDGWYRGASLTFSAPVIDAGGRGALTVVQPAGIPGEWFPAKAWTYVTSDGGDHWSDPRPMSYTRALVSRFVTPSVGWTVGAGIALTTSDAGRSWVQTGAPTGAVLTAVTPVDAMNAWATAAPVAPLPSRLFRTSDGGLTWSEVALPGRARAAW